MTIQTIGAEHHAFSFRPDVEPVLRVSPGDVVRFETSTEPSERLFAAGDAWAQASDSQRINAVTGPVFIEGVEPGDVVSVEILAVETLDWGWISFIKGRGSFTNLVANSFLRRVPIREGRVWINDRLSLPVQPMIGCLGLAPAHGASSTLAPPYPWAGNYDLLQMKPGNTALFPAQAPGGLFSLGDLHAAMGAAELTGISIECAGAATVRFGLRRGVRLETPRVETPERLYVVGLAEGRDWQAARQHACDLMFDYLTAERGLSPEDAFTLFSAAVDVEFGGPAGAVVLASVPLALLE